MEAIEYKPEIAARHAAAVNVHTAYLDTACLTVSKDNNY